MVFTPPPHLPPLPGKSSPASPRCIGVSNSVGTKDIPDSIPVGEFLHSEKYGRQPIQSSQNPYTCGITGKTYSTNEVARRIDCLARAISSRLSFNVAEGTEWDRVICVYSLNTVRLRSFILMGYKTYIAVAGADLPDRLHPADACDSSCQWHRYSCQRCVFCTGIGAAASLVWSHGSVHVHSAS